MKIYDADITCMVEMGLAYLTYMLAKSHCQRERLDYELNALKLCGVFLHSLHKMQKLYGGNNYAEGICNDLPVPVCFQFSSLKSFPLPKTK